MDGARLEQLLAYSDAEPGDFLTPVQLQEEVPAYKWRNIFLGHFRCV